MYMPLQPSDTVYRCPGRFVVGEHEALKVQFEVVIPSLGEKLYRIRITCR